MLCNIRDQTEDTQIGRNYRPSRAVVTDGGAVYPQIIPRIYGLQTIYIWIQFCGQYILVYISEGNIDCIGGPGNHTVRARRHRTILVIAMFRVSGMFTYRNRAVTVGTIYTASTCISFSQLGQTQRRDLSCGKLNALTQC